MKSKRRVVVVGAGAAGLVAAGQAASSGARTFLLERMDRPGRKLRITGKGRCNLTNVSPLRDFIKHFGPNGRFLYQPFSRFFTADLISLLHELGIDTVVERGGRVFPASEQARDVVDGLADWIQGQGVALSTHTRVQDLVIEDETVAGIEVAQTSGTSPEALHNWSQIGSQCLAEAVIIATGGVSYPGTGSTGDGYRLAASAGHTIIPIRPGLVPLETDGDTAPRLQGLSLRNVRLHVFSNGQQVGEAFGEMLFTHFGISGPIVLTVSKSVVAELAAGRRVTISIDLKPALDRARLDARLRRDLDAHGKQQFATILKGLLPRKLIPVCLDEVSVPQAKQANQVSAEERGRLREWLKDFRLTITAHRPIEEAIVTSGGVNLSEINPRTMESRIISGLYFAGEVLDLDADTGGYNLQAAFSTGWLAGTSAALSR
jgi:predicted Rossmann fold flavoprotein